MYSYIGVLVNDSGTFDVADVMIDPIICEQLNVPRENQTIIKVRNMLPGIYEAWHILNEKHEVCELLLLHHTYNFDSIHENDPFCAGVVCAALSRAVCIVDERYHFDSCYSYFKLEGEAFYDGDDILKHLPEAPYPESIKEKLRVFVELLRRNGKHPTGAEIYNITRDYVIWNLFRSNKINSSHWAVDVMNRLKGNIPATVFKGGAVSKCDPGFLPCYVYRNKLSMVYAIRIPLDQIDVYASDGNNGTSKIIKFPERTDKVSHINFSGNNMN